MSKHGARPGKLRISGNGMAGGTQIEMDGEDIAPAISGLTVRMEAGAMPTAVLDVVLWELDEELVSPRVTVPDKTRDLLVRLGWTPPAEEEPS